MKRRSLLILMVMCGLLLAAGVQAQSTLPADRILTIAQAVVYIEAEPLPNADSINTGSGTLVSPTGKIYTNRHVIEGSESFAIYMQQQIGELPTLMYHASLVDAFNEIDFAILQIDRDADGRALNPETLNLPYLEIFQPQISLGERVMIFGFPSIGDGYLVVTQGSITSLENVTFYGERLPGLLRTDAEISPGNSGGLAVNADGAFIGIPTEVRKEDRTLGRLGGILPFAAIERVSAMRAEFAARPGEMPSISVVNNSTSVICYVFIAPSTSTTWGADQLGRSEVLEPGTTREWPVEPGMYDVLLEDCERNQLLDSRENTVTSDVSLTYGGDAQQVEGGLYVEVFEIEHNTTVPGQTENGMRMHLYAWALGYAGQTLNLKLEFFWEDGTRVSGANAAEANRSAEGNLVITSVLAPGFNETVWEDYIVWLPYASFPKGLSGRQGGYVLPQLWPDGSEAPAFVGDPFEFIIIYGD
jgi:hypothetical protein